MEQEALISKKSIYQAFKTIISYIVSDINKNPRSFKIGLFTIYLVVTFLALIQSAFQMSPLIFLQLAETQAGDTDFILTPTPPENRTRNSNQNYGPPSSSLFSNDVTSIASGFTLINSSEIQEVIKDINGIFDQSPRWLLVGDLSNPNETVNKISENIKSFVLMIDSLQEISIGIGRRLETDILFNDEVLITESTLRGLNLTVGQPINLKIDIINLLSTYVPVNSSVAGSNDDQAQQFIMGVMDQVINQPLRQYFGDNITNRVFQTEELRSLSDEIKKEADNIENDPQLKEDYKQLIEDYINDLDIDQAQKDQLIDLVETISKRNLSEDATRIQDFVYDLPDENVTIIDVEEGLTDLIIQGLDFNITLKVKQSVSSSKGKWADGLGNVLAVDYRNFTNLTVDFFLQGFDNIINNNLNDTTIIGSIARAINIDDVSNFVHNYSDSINLSDFSLSSNMILQNRVNMYSDAGSIDSQIIDISNKFYSIQGFDFPVDGSITLGTAIKNFLIMKNFIDNLIVSATFLLLMLSVLLIYSLMIGDVEDKTYEFGMLRALGFQKRWLIFLLLIQAMVFAIPGLSLGLITAYLLNTLVAMFLFDSTVLYSSYQLAPSAIGLAFGLGIFIPLVSNVLPIMRALSKTLRDSLDIYHRTVNEILVTVVKLEKMGISLAQTLSALLLVVMGFVSYYLIPMAFIFSNIKLALAVINIILIIMIIGFVLLISLIEVPFEKLILNLMLCIYRKDRNLKTIILKNMQGHYNRNWKTTLMYTIALAFLIFSGTGFTLQTKVIADVLQSTLGSDMTVLVLGDQIGLNEYQIRQYMEQYKIDYPGFIDEYAFSTYQLNQIVGMPRSCQISTLARFPQDKIKLSGVDETFLRATMQQFYIPNEYDESIQYPSLQNGKKDGVYGLYDRTGNIDIDNFQDSKMIQSNINAQKSFYDDLNFSQPGIQYIDREINMIIPQGYSFHASIDVNTPSLLQVGNSQFRVKVRHMATKVPGFAFSSYRTVTFFGEGIISMNDTQYILNEYFGADIEKGIFPNAIVENYFQQLPKNLTYGLPKDSLYIKFARSTSRTERIDFGNGLRNFFRDQKTLLFDVIQLKADAEDTFMYINLFYIIVALVAMILSFFLILVSFVSNVKENSWEFGVLRAVGLDKSQITRVYIYEAVSLITASGLLGTIVGMVVAVTLILQILMFVELPFSFQFPTAIFLITFIGGFTTAIGASYLSVKEIRDKSISIILKGLI